MTGTLPDHDAADPVETAVIRGLVRSWSRRATVRRTEPELDGPTMDDLYDDDCVDYPETLLPFAGHPGWNGLDEDRRSRVRAWGWIAYNKNVVDIEQDVVTPGSACCSGMPSALGSPTPGGRRSSSRWSTRSTTR